MKTAIVQFTHLILSWKKFIAIILFLTLAGAWGIFIYSGSHPMGDWQRNYRPPTLAILRGESPYQFARTNNPPWTYLFLIPFALLPPAIGNAVVGIVGMSIIGYVGYKRGANPIPLSLLLLTPNVLFLSRNGGIDWLVALGFIMPPQMGLFFVMIKPQLGIIVALFWFVEAWNTGKLKQIARVFSPIGLAYILSYLLFGLHAIIPNQFDALSTIKFPWDATLFPFSIPIGLVLTISSLRLRDFNKAILASPFLSPYVAFYSWPVTLLGLADNPWYMSAGVIGLMITTIFTRQF